MSLDLVGTFPVSGVNSGLQASTPVLTAQIASLGADITQLGLAAAGQVAIAAMFPPDPVTYTAAFGAAINPASLTVSMGSLGVTAAPISIELGIKLGLVDAKLALAASLAANLEAGLSVDGLCAWSYSGSARGYGLTLQRDTSNGFGTIGGATTISAIIVATESFASWGAMSQGANVGNSANAPAAGDTLTFLGALRGSSINIGAWSLKERIDLFLAELRGQKSQLEANIQTALGLDLPDPTVTGNLGLQAIADLGIDGLIANLVLQVDLTASIGKIQAKIDAILVLQANLAAQLSAGGLCVWRYSGPANGLGTAFAAATENGIPGGTGPNAGAYGLAVASLPANMNTFGTIFLT